MSNSCFISQFLLCGSNMDAITHTWCDIMLTKDFWRSALTAAKVSTPEEVARWTGADLEIKQDLRTDLVVKLLDSYLGKGDSFWRAGIDFSSENDLDKLLQTNYPNKEATLLKLIRPLKSLGVHSLDIVTIRTPGGDVKVLSVILWADCTTSSSHSSRAAYVVDANTGVVTSAMRWYCAAFAAKDSTHLVGARVPGARRACELAVTAHKMLSQQWLVAVGWDAMVEEAGDVVFFEGNFAGMRTSRRFFLSFKALKAAVSDFFWPFGNSHTVQPVA